MRRATPRRRRLSKTAVEQAVRETSTKDFIYNIGNTAKYADGRHFVDVHLFDAFDDPRSTPAGAALIGHLEASGWTVTHHHGRRYSRLTVFEPVVANLSA